MSEDGAATAGGTLVLLSEAFQSHGGIQRYGRNLVQALLCALPGETLRVVVLNDAPAAAAVPEWAGVRATGCTGSRVAFALHSWRWLLAARPRRVIVGHRNLLPVTALLALLPRRHRPRLWLLAYGVEFAPRATRIEKRLWNGLDRVLAISPHTAERVAQAGGPARTDLLPCSLPPGFELPALSLPSLQPPQRLLCVSRLTSGDRYKGVDVTVRAVSLLRQRQRNVVLDVIGAGDDLPRLRRCAGEANATSAVTFHGACDGPALRRAFRECDLFVLPSTEEGFGLVYLEAMAWARPVIAAAAGGAPFVVRPGVSGWLAPPDDAEALAILIEERIGNPQGTRALARKGRAFVEENYSFQQFVRRVRALIGGPPGNG